jgi:hypothetical protein
VTPSGSGRSGAAWFRARCGRLGLQLGQSGRVLASLAPSVLAAVIGAAVLVTGLEALSTGLRHVLHWGLLFMPVSPVSYGTFVGAAVGAEAVFLALFFTTVGVIASTTYSQVPAEILIYTRFWLGLISRCEHVDAEQLASSFDEATPMRRSPYAAGAPRRLLELFEAIANGIEFEQRTEHRRVTPAWWVHHMAARTLLDILVSAISVFLGDVRSELIDPLIADMSSDAAPLTIRVLDSLELVNKLTFHPCAAHQAVAGLNVFRHEPTKDEFWPDGSLPDEVAVSWPFLRENAKASRRHRPGPANPDDSRQPVGRRP